MSYVIANLLSGLLGAVLGGLIVVGVQGWQLWTAKRQSQAAARLIHLEILFNIDSLQAGQRRSPAQLHVSSGMWERHSQDLVALLSESEAAQVALPYLQLDSYRAYFHQDAADLLGDRMRADDVKALSRLAESFQVAEKSLRPHVWTRKRAERIGELIAHSMSGSGNQLPTVNKRMMGVLAGTPVPPWLTLLAVSVVLGGTITVIGRVSLLLWRIARRAK